MMRTYWIETDQPYSLGCGVTARSSDDAEYLARIALSGEYTITSIEVVENVASLDQGHVVPNMGNVLRRGIWYPLGLEHLPEDNGW